MLAFIAMALPAVLMVALWERLFPSDNHDKKLLEYVASVLLLNTLDLVAVNYIAKSSGSVFYKITESNSFTLKYIVLSCVLAVGIPCVVKYAKEYVTVSFHISALQANRRIPYRLLAVLYTIALFLLNFIRIFDNNFWGDESFSILLSKMSVSQMIQATAADVHPPLYYLLLIGGYRLFGEHGWTFHVVSILPYAVTLIFIMTVIWKEFGKTTAIFMVTFVSLLPTAVTYNVEVRMYSLAALFMLWSYYAFYRILTKGNKGSYVLFVLTSLCAAYTHYYAMMSVAFFYLALLVLVVMKKLKLRSLIVVYAATITGYAPWLLAMLGAFKRTSESFWMTGFPTFKEGCLYFFSSNKTWYSCLMLLIAFLLVVGIVAFESKVITVQCAQKKTEITISTPYEKLTAKSFWLVWGLIASFGTIVLGELISILIRPAFTLRYLYPVVIVMWLVFSVAISHFEWIKKYVAPILLMLTLLICTKQYVSVYRAEKSTTENCDATLKFMQSTIKDEDVLLTNGSHLNWTVLECYLPEISHQYISAGYDAFDEDTTYWLVWVDDLSESELEWLDAANYTPTEVYHVGVLGSNYFHLYQLEQKESSDDFNYSSVLQ
jgi:4-amino-4-deoxy-L-arabinose transferase-like glycosyltransferase